MIIFSTGPVSPNNWRRRSTFKQAIQISSQSSITWDCELSFHQVKTELNNCSKHNISFTYSHSYMYPNMVVFLVEYWKPNPAGSDYVILSLLSRRQLNFFLGMFTVSSELVSHFMPPAGKIFLYCGNILNPVPKSHVMNSCNLQPHFCVIARN